MLTVIEVFDVMKRKTRRRTATKGLVFDHADGYLTESHAAQLVQSWNEDDEQIKPIGRVPNQNAKPTARQRNMTNWFVSSTKLSISTNNSRDQLVYEQGLISILRQLHDELDARVFEAYGWPATLSEEEILDSLVTLNSQRSEEERTGLVRWLRTDYQRPEAVAAGFGEGFERITAQIKKEPKIAWPKTIPETARAVRQALTSQVGAVTSKNLAKKFSRASTG